MFYLSKHSRTQHQGAIQNLDYWADLNGCNGIAPELITINEDYDIRGYSQCDSNAEGAFDEFVCGRTQSIFVRESNITEHHQVPYFGIS